MSARYTPLPSRSETTTNRELDEAFESDNEDDAQETTPLTVNSPPQSTVPVDDPPATSAGYDFEREYDVPPPGSPPRPSSVALPNNFGNSNALIPS